MISPLLFTQNSTPIASVQQHMDAQPAFNSNIAHMKVQEHERMLKETVIQKDEAVFYEQHHDAKEEGRNKYQRLYDNKKKKKEVGKESDDAGVNRVEFDLRL